MSDHIEQLAMFMAARDAAENGKWPDGQTHPTWDELGPGGQEAYRKDAEAVTAALRVLGWAPTATPTDDEREALMKVLQDRHVWHSGASYDEDASAIFAAGFRRPGPITDAQVEAAAQSLSSLSDEEWSAVGHQEHMEFYWVSARLALEAARAAS